MKYLLMMLLGCCLISAVHADDEGEKNTLPADLPFWSISSGDFHAEKPRAISVPGAGGRMEYYWYWTFKFRYRTNLEIINDYMSDMQKRLEQKDATRDAEMLKLNIARLENTIKKINQEGGDDESDDENRAKVEKQHWKLGMYITLRTDTEQILSDIGSEVVRNLVERQENKRFYTTREIQRLKKKDIPETFDQTYGRGHWVNGIAIFSGLPPKSRQFEVRVSGMGQRVIPTFVPGQRIYCTEMLRMESATQPTLRRALRFFYHKIGQSGEVQLDTVQFVRRSTEWLWVWPLQIYPGCFRHVEIERNPELKKINPETGEATDEDIEAIKRRYVYLPYFIWNNTQTQQDFAVRQAGVVEDIEWGGEKIRVVIYDDGEADGRWKNKVMQQIRVNLEEGKEAEFVEEHEMYPVRYDEVDIQEYYKKNFKGLDYIDSTSGAEDASDDLQEHLKEVSAKMNKELEDKKKADKELKASFKIDEENRLFAGSIPAGKMVNGVAIMQWGVTNIDELIDGLISRLQMRALLNQPVDEEKDKLFSAYLKIRKPAADATRPWTTKAEPDRLTVINMLAKMAENELGDTKVTEDDIRRYGPAAAIGALFNELAWKKIEERAKLGVTDIYFNVRTAGANDTAFITAQFQRYLPQTGKEIPPEADPFAEVGTKKGAAQGTAAGTSDGKKTENKTEEEEVW